MYLFEENFCLYLRMKIQSENFFGILISTRLLVVMCRERGLETFKFLCGHSIFFQVVPINSCPYKEWVFILVGSTWRDCFKHILFTTAYEGSLYIYCCFLLRKSPCNTVVKLSMTIKILMGNIKRELLNFNAKMLANLCIFLAWMGFVVFFDAWLPILLWFLHHIGYGIAVSFVMMENCTASIIMIM